MNHPRRTILKSIAALGLYGSGHAGFAANYPTRPVTLVVPFTPGSATDVVARVIAQQFEKQFRQPCLVDNRAGAGGTLGAAAVAASEADGHTLLVHSTGHLANAALYPKLKYDTMRDFVPISLLATVPSVIVVTAASGLRSLAQLVERGKSKPNALTYASAGNGSGSHIGAEKFRIAAGFESLHVPYKGAAPALNDLLGGRVDWLVAPAGTVLPFIREGRLVALAVETPRRTALLTNVPTTLESGYPDSDYDFWIGLFAPARTPGPVVEQLHAGTAAWRQDPTVQARLRDAGAETVALGQHEFAAQVQREAAAVTAFIKRHGIQAE
ncbi:MAG: tripartite tricarboxylate transporter substrate binding protein [Rhizobiales bacterium]|nr:tripartite tricarboxylate transporter substrate binding protein [Rhizobacter sp.]